MVLARRGVRRSGERRAYSRNGRLLGLRQRELEESDDRVRKKAAQTSAVCRRKVGAKSSVTRLAAADYFNVSPSAVTTLLVNHGLMERDHTWRMDAEAA